MNNKILPLCLLALSSICCEPELPGLVQFKENQPSFKSIDVRVEDINSYNSKTSYGDNIENVFSGAVLAAYNADTGLLDSETQISPGNLGGNMTLNLPEGRYNFYLLGNLWLINDSKQSKQSIAFPYQESDVKDIIYRMDGGDIGSGSRRESFSDISKYGIPLFWSSPSTIDVSQTKTLSISMHRLFSKLIVSIDHSGISGEELSDFINESVRVKQANCRIEPFSINGSKAFSEDDIVPEGDCDAVMENDLLREYEFYIPENRQGVLMPLNDDPSLKDVEAVEAANGNNGISRLLTFVEFTGRMNNSSTGLDGVVRYRFFLGNDATTDFDIKRNTSIKVFLGFNLNSIFKPDWKVDSEDLSDNRQFFLSSPLVGKLPNGKTVAVRKNRPGRFNLNICKSEGSGNMIASTALVNRDYTPASVRDLAWTSNCWSLTHNSDNEQARYALANLGISVEYNAGEFVFKVTNPSLFVSGVDVPISFTLFPGNKMLTATISTYDDISVTESCDRDLQTDYYLAQSRSLSFSGFAGEKIYYLADQNECGPRSSGKHTFNRQWKASSGLQDKFPSCVLGADGNIVFPYESTSQYESQSLEPGSILNIYAFYPNTFASDHSYTSKAGTIYICSDDALNDDLFSLPIKVKEPYYKWSEGLQDVILLIDGTEQNLIQPYMNIEKTKYFKTEEFDDELYELLLKPSIRYSTNFPWSECAVYDDKTNNVYIGKTDCTAGDIIEKAKADAVNGYLSIGPVFFAPNKKTGLYGLNEKVMYCKISVPFFPSNVKELELNYFSSDELNSEFFIFSVYYYGGDLSNCQFDMIGPKSSYRCSTYPYDIIYPVYDKDIRSNNISLYYRELSQIESVNGEKIPGGLLVPYGEQTISLKTVNKWSGEEYLISHKLTIKYNLTFGQFGVFGAGRYATIYFMPQKNINYMLKIGKDVSLEKRRWMLKVIGADEWKRHISTKLCYLNTYLGIYYDPEQNYNYPRTDYDVKFVSGSSSVWTQALAKKSYEDINYMWLNTLQLVNINKEVQQSPNSDPTILGSEWLTAFFCTSKFGYVWSPNLTYL